MGEVADKTYGGGTPKTSIEEYWQGNIPWIQSQDLSENKVFGVEPRKYINQKAIENSATKIIPKNSIAIITRVGVGKLALMPISYCTSQDFLSLSSLKINELYATYVIYKMLQIEKEKVQGTSIKGITSAELLSKKIDVPIKYAEQQKVGEYFSNLDCLITLHQRKLFEAKNNPKNGSKNFFRKIYQKLYKFDFNFKTYDWEQRKLGEIVERVTRKNQSLQSQLPLTISAQFGLIDQNEFFDKRIASKDVSGYYLIKNGEFAYNKSTSVDAPWGAIKRLDRYEMGVLSTLYIVFRIRDSIKTNSDYIVTYYDTNIWHKEVKAIAAEGARNHGLLNITPSDFFETVIALPKDFEEQQKIGEYFSNLDNLITLHQREVFYTLKHIFYRCCDTLLSGGL